MGVGEWSVGSHIVLQTHSGEEISSEIFAYDKNTNCLVLKEPGANPGAFNLRLLKANYVKSVISTNKPEQTFDLELPYVDLEQGRKRFEKASKKAEKEASRVGVGVTKEAQALFDALSRTMPCRWENQTIVVLEEVYVSAPYMPDQCTSDDSHKPTLERVRKVLQAERQRLEQKTRIKP